LLLGGFQADGLDEIVECLNDGGISTIEGGDLFFWDRSVSGKGLQNAGIQWSIDFFIKLRNTRQIWRWRYENSKGRNAK
jgi:hypothetical protein